MTSRFSVLLVVAIAAAAIEGNAQRAQSLPPPPVSLTVPHPIPPVPTSPPKDLFLVPQPPPPPDFNNPIILGPTVFAPWGYGPFLAPPPSPPPPPSPSQGWLRFETSPGSAQVYVDGAYAGVVDDFGISGRPIDIIVGRHHVELRADGYTTLGFDVNILPNQTLRYRGDLQRLSPAMTQVAPVAKTTYIIPNCYAGDRPPTRPLPAGCSLKIMQVRKP